MGNKKVCPFGGKPDNFRLRRVPIRVFKGVSLYYRQIGKSVPTVPKCALFSGSKIIPYTERNYNKVCPCAPHFEGRKGENA